MEGGDLLGAYERACELAEQKAGLAGVIAPMSALHKEQAGSTMQTNSENEIVSFLANSSSD
jgi:hypothetical protein